MQVPGDSGPSVPYVATGRPKLTWPLILLGLFLCCGIPGLIGSSIFGFFSRNKNLVQDQLCISNLRAVAAAQAMYSVDNSGKLPQENWMDATLPYLKENKGAIGCPTVRNKERDEYGFAMNQAVIGKLFGSVQNLGETPSVFDSTILQRNAVASTSTLPKPGRHKRQDSDPQFTREGNNVAFLDGSARWTSKREF